MDILIEPLYSRIEPLYYIDIYISQKIHVIEPCSGDFSLGDKMG